MTNGTPLQAAAKIGHDTVVQRLLAAGADPNEECEGTHAGRTALHAATCHGHDTVVQTLLRAGADANKVSKNGRTPLIEAARIGNVTIAKTLLEAGADVKMLTTVMVGPCPLSVTALMAATLGGNPAVIKLFLGAGADVNQATPDGTTPLYHAAARGQLEAVRALLDAGARADLTHNESMKWGIKYCLTPHGFLPLLAKHNHSFLFKPINAAINVSIELAAIIEEAKKTDLQPLPLHIYNRNIMHCERKLNSYKEVIVLLSQHDHLRNAMVPCPASSSSSLIPPMIISSERDAQSSNATDKRDKDAAGFRERHGKRQKDEPSL